MGNDDYTLIRSVLAGEKDAYGLLVARHSQSVCRVAFRVMENEADADEAVRKKYYALNLNALERNLDASLIRSRFSGMQCR